MRILLAPLLLAATSSAAFGQGKIMPAMFEDDGPSRGPGYRSFGVAIPFTFTRDTVVRFDFNLGGHAAIGLEAQYLRKGEEVGEAEQQETGESLVTNGRGASLILARYSNGATLSGFFWGLGIGYREQTAEWAVTPDEDDPEVDYSLVADDELLHHAAVLKGPTAHIRIGYRYVGSEVPLSLGFYVGVRHFQSSVKDDDDVAADDQSAMSEAAYAALTDRENERLKRRFATAPEPGLEIGFVF